MGKIFGTTKEGKQVLELGIENGKGLSASVLTYGCIVKNLWVHNEHGDIFDTVLGYESLIDYEEDGYYMGAVIGRVANRIENSYFKLNDRRYELLNNSGRHHLHGGRKGFNKRVWKLKDKQKNKVVLSRRSEHMEEGYPGTLEIDVSYEVSDDNELIIKYKAVSDLDTPISLTNHSYFKLDNSQNILNHRLRVFSNEVILNSDEVIPLKAVSVAGYDEFDFREEKTIGDFFPSRCEELKKTAGYDNSFVFSDEKMRKMAELSSPKSGLNMTVSSNTRAVHIYSGNFLNIPNAKNGAAYGPQAGICFETGAYPNAVNRNDFPHTILRAGDVYNKESRYKFSGIK